MGECRVSQVVTAKITVPIKPLRFVGSHTVATPVAAAFPP